MQFTIQTIVNAISLGSLYAIVALGIAVVFSVMRLINFAHGVLIMLGAFVVWALSGQGVIIWGVATLAAVAAAALLMERIAFRPVRGSDMTTLLVTSFAVNAIIQDTALLLSGGLAKSVSLPGVFSSSFSVRGYEISGLSIITLAVTTVALGALSVFFAKSATGVQMRAAAEDFTMARLVGIRANTVIGVAFAISGVLAGLAGILFVAQLGTVQPSFGFQPVVIGFVATVIGGMGSLPGSVIGGFILGATTTALDAWLPSGMEVFRDSLLYIAVIVLLLVRPQGLFGTRARAA